MRFLDFGPEPIQVTGYRGGDNGPPATAGGRSPVRTVSAFYQQTRDRNWPWDYSAACLGAPAAILATSVWVATRILHVKSIASQPTPDTVAKLCKTEVPPLPLQNALTAAALHFAVSHVLLLLAGAFAFAFALRSIRNIVSIHGGAFVERVGAFWIALAGTLALGLLVYAVAIPSFGPLSAALFGMLKSSAQLTAGSSAASSCLASARSLSAAFDAEAIWGVRLVALSSSALAAAAATIAWRFEIHEIDGVWADTYVLRHKLKALLTLFVLGSLLLVASNIALSAYADLGASVIEALQPPKGDAASPGETAADPAGGANKDASADKTSMAKPSNDFAEVDSLQKALLNVVGALSSLTLVGMFLPAFAGLTSEIEMAGKTHADADMRVDPPPPPPEEIVVVIDPISGAAAAVAQQPRSHPKTLSPDTRQSSSGRRPTALPWSSAMSRQRWRRPPRRCFPTACSTSPSRSSTSPEIHGRSRARDRTRAVTFPAARRKAIARPRASVGERGGRLALNSISLSLKGNPDVR